jgi:hypothetical protein
LWLAPTGEGAVPLPAGAYRFWYGALLNARIEATLVIFSFRTSFDLRTGEQDVRRAARIVPLLRSGA